MSALSTSCGEYTENSDSDSDSEPGETEESVIRELRNQYRNKLFKHKAKVLTKNSVDNETVAQNACIARNVGRAEMDRNEKVTKAQNSEWSKLWDQKV